MSKPTDRQLVDWLRHLGQMVAPSNIDVTERIAKYVPDLQGRYSSAEFDSTSREHVARRCKFFPSYAELCDALDSLPSRAPQPVSATPDARGMTEDDRNWLKFWHKRMDEIDQQTEGWKRGSRDAEIANLDSLIATHAPLVARLLHPENVLIRDTPTDAQRAYVSRALRMPGAPLAGRPMPEDERKPRPSHPPAETLRAMREARGIRVQENAP